MYYSMTFHDMVCTALYHGMAPTKSGFQRQGCTSTYWYIPVYTCMYWYILVHTSMDWYVLVYTGMYWYVLVCSCTNQYVLVCTCLYWYVLIGVDTGVHGSHRDAAMPPPSSDQASREDGDSHPCPEEEEFFQSRPDAADMEEAIGKFMEGMEKPELLDT